MTDNQFEQVFGMLTKVVSSVQALEKGQDELRVELNEFREETREGFDKLNCEK